MTQKPAEKLYACKVMRDFWQLVPSDISEEDGRVRAGKIIEVDAETALAGVESGTLHRLKA